MVNFNERINEILSRLEAVAAEQDQPVYRARPAAEPDVSFYTAAEEPLPTPAEDIAGPGDFALAIKKQEQEKEQQVESRSSPTGREPYAITSRERTRRFSQLQTDQLIQGVIMAEILGKPLAKRRGRGRYGF